ncbi:MAG: SDR family NAD(P)-dependent oxidoreductase [Patescibacteria group bacterium]
MEKRNKFKKAVVTGGAGFIGSNLVDALIGEGFSVSVIDNLSAGKKENLNQEAKFFNADIRDVDAIEEAFKEADLVFHTAALPRVQYSIENPIETHEVNVTGTLNVLGLSAKHGVGKFILSSSSAVYGDQEERAMKESDGIFPKSPYALHKYIDEEYCRLYSDMYSLPTVSLRYFNVYGKNQDPEGAYALVIAKFLEKKKKGEKLTITGDGEQTRDFVHIRDVVRANILAAYSKELNSGEVLNIGSGRSVSINQTARLIGGEVEYIDPRLEPRHTLSDSKRAEEVLGWKPSVSIEEGIEELKVEQGV